MLVRTLKLTDKNQITIPADAVRAMRLKRGAELLLVQDGNRLVLVDAREAGKRVLDELSDFGALGLSSFHDVWDNEEDEVWNEY